MTPENVGHNARAVPPERPPGLGSVWLVAELLRSPALEPDAALLAVAAACAGCDTQAVLERLDVAALSLFGARRLRCAEQAERVADVLTNGLGLVCEPEDPSTLLIDRALTGRRAHPLVIACVGREIARRAGLRSYVCQSVHGWWTAIVAEGRIALVGNGVPPPPIDLDALEGVCPHGVARAALCLLAQGATGSWAARATELLRALPPLASDPARHLPMT